MTRYLLSIHHPWEGGPPEDIDRIMADLAVVRRDMRAQGAWVFTGGLHPPDTATVVHGDLVTDGPFAEVKEALGGITILDAPDLDAALGWARRITGATGLPVEVRPFAD